MDQGNVRAPTERPLIERDCQLRGTRATPASPTARSTDDPEVMQERTSDMREGTGVTERSASVPHLAPAARPTDVATLVGDTLDAEIEGHADAIRPRWDVLTNHGYVLLAVAENPTARVRDLATRVGITERAAYRILADLIHAGYMTSRRNGRRNVYTVHEHLSLGHPICRSASVRGLLLLGPAGAGAID
jgi:hypothetical protein